MCNKLTVKCEQELAGALRKEENKKNKVALIIHRNIN